MPQIPQPLNTNAAFILGSGGETVQPIEHGNGTGILLIKDNGDPGHNAYCRCSHYCEHKANAFSRVSDRSGPRRNLMSVIVDRVRGSGGLGKG